MDETVHLPTIVEGNQGFGGMGLGAGFIGGLVLGSIWNGNGFGGWGGNRAQAGADLAIQSGIQNLNNQVQNAALSQLQSAAGITAGINANTVSQLQSQNAMQQQMCCCCNNLSREIDATGDGISAELTNSRIQDMQNTQQISNGLANLGQAITNQGYQNQLQTKDVLAALSQQHAALSAQIAQENCADRELMREIQSQAIRDKLAECQNQNAALTAQINLSNQLQSQTLYLISQLKPITTTAAAGA